MEVRAEHTKNAGSTPFDAPIETLMIRTCCREKYFSDNKNKDPQTFVLSTKEFNKKLFIHGANSYWVERLTPQTSQKYNRSIVILRRTLLWIFGM